MFKGMDLLKQMRIEKGMKQYEVAKVLNVSDSYVSKVENGENKYSLEQIQKLMKLYSLDLLRMKVDGSIDVINKRYKDVVLRDTELYFMVKTSNEIISCIREVRELTQSQFSEFLNVVQTTISSWENFKRSIRVDTLFDILKKCSIPMVYIAQESIIVPKNDKDKILKTDNLYGLAKKCCETVLKDNPMNSYILGDLEYIYKSEIPYSIYYAKTPLESAYKMIEINPDAFLDEFIGQDLLSNDSTLDDMYNLIDKNPSIFEEVLSNSFYAFLSYRFEGEGLYLNFGDGGYDTLKVNTILENMGSEEFDTWSEKIDPSQVNMELVDKVYDSLLKSIY